MSLLNFRTLDLNLLRVFNEVMAERSLTRAARKADPECRVLAGIGYLQEGQIFDDFEKFLPLLLCERQRTKF